MQIITEPAKAEVIGIGSFSDSCPNIIISEG
jgi:hypothetical protein